MRAALILSELRAHAPFTFFGASTGILVMILVSMITIPPRISYTLFYMLHPLHVLMSALVTTSMYKLHAKSSGRVLMPILIGYAGSIGTATLSDSIIPYLGEIVLNLPNRGAHIGFLEEWWLVNPMALLGIVIASAYPTTKVPHSGHVLLSTWASLAHIIMSLGGAPLWYSYFVIFFFLFISVWIPCCFSDIVFPLFFVKHK
jgi:hypothetical protein